MAAEGRTALKAYFQTGDTPTEAQFVNLIDSQHNATDDGTAATLTGTETLTNKTVTAPVLSGTVTGTYTLGGTPTFPAAVVQTTGAQNLADKTIDGDNNTISNLDLGNEVDWAAAADVTDRAAFASGDKLIIFEAGAGLRKIDYDDLPGAGGGLSNVSEDTTPQLGGDLDLNGKAVGFVGSNSTGSQITKGTPVYINGASNSIAPADANGSGTMPCVGIAAEDIADSGTGVVAILGTVSGIDTSSFSADDTLYISDTAGTLSASVPTAGQTQAVARVITSHATTGTIFVTIFQAGQELANLTDSTTSVGADKILLGDASATPAFSGITRTVTNFIADHSLAVLTDLASTANGDGAALIGIEDSAGDITATTVEGALAEIAALLPAGTIVGTTDTQTLTNKTLTSPKIAHPITTDADNYTLDADDQSAIIRMTSGSANTLTIPPNSSVAFPIGTKVEIWSEGAGTTTILGDTGVTLQGNGGSASAGSCDIQTQYGGATLSKVATDTWNVGGDIDTVA